MDVIKLLNVTVTDVSTTSLSQKMRKSDETGTAFCSFCVETGIQKSFFRAHLFIPKVKMTMENKKTSEFDLGNLTTGKFLGKMKVSKV